MAWRCLEVVKMAGRWLKWLGGGYNGLEVVKMAGRWLKWLGGGKC